MSAAMSNMSPEGRQLLARYADRGWFDAAGDPRLKEDRAPGHPRRAYLVLASGTLIPALCEVQITTRCNYRAFRGARMLVASVAARRFDLLDLSIMYRSQFRRDERLPLRTYEDEAMPELIQWPLDVCGAGVEVVTRAIISAAGDDEGAVFELILLGEVI